MTARPMFTMDPPGYWDEFDYYQIDHVRSLVPYNLGPAIQRLLECKGAAIEEFEAARDGLEKAMKEEWKDL